MQRQSQRSESQDGAQRRDRPSRRDRGDRVDRAEREQYYAKPFSGGRQNKEPDHNSPFAKLAALKQQLEQNSKES
jgi:ATP-dependent RNA helicase SUPV3L1/SUV3